MIQLQNGDRDAFVDSMREENIECSVHYIPLHLFDFYQKQYGYCVGDFPIAERVFERVVSLPLHPGLTEKDIHIVIENNWQTSFILMCTRDNTTCRTKDFTKSFLTTFVYLVMCAADS